MRSSITTFTVPSISPYEIRPDLMGGVRKPLQLRCEGKEAHSSPRYS